MARNKRKKRRSRGRGYRPAKHSGRTLTMGFVFPDGDPYGEFQALLLIDSSGAVMAPEVGFRPLAADAVRGCIDRAFRATGLPDVVHTNDLVIATVCRELVPSVPVTVVDRLPALEEMAASLTGFLGAPADDRARAEATPFGVVTHGAEIMRAAARIVEAAPWEIANDSEPITLVCEGVELTHDTFVILGNAGQVYGVMGFESLDAWRQFVLRQISGGGSPMGGDHLGLILYPADEAPKDLRRAQRERGWPRRDFYPAPSKVGAGALDANLVDDRACARTLAVSLEALAEFCEAHLVHADPDAGPLNVDIDTPTGGRVQVTYHGWLDAATGEPVNAGAGAPTAFDAPPVGGLWPAFEYPHRLISLSLDDAFFRAAAKCAAHEGGDLRRDPELPAVVPALVVRSSKRDARRGRRAIDGLMTLYDVPATETHSGCLMLGGADGPELLLTPYNISSSPLDPIRAKIDAAGGRVWLVLTGGGLVNTRGRLSSTSVVGIVDLAVRADPR